MRTGRPKAPLTLTPQEEAHLNSLAHRSRTAPAPARRARIVLACAQGHDNKAVAKRLQLSPSTVGKWRARFVSDRLDGLYDEPRPERWTPKFGQVAKVGSRPRRRSLECHGRDGVILLS